MEQAKSRALPRLAILYICAMGLAGLAALVFTLRTSPIEFSPRLILYLVIALAGSGMKVPFPGVFGSISVNYVFTFLALLEFSASETLLLGLASVVVQTFWHAKDRPRPVQLFFNLSCISITIVAAAFVYEQPWFRYVSEGQLLRLAIAGGVYYIVNTLSVALVIALASKQNIDTIWKAIFDWAFAYYLVGICLAEMVHLSIERVGSRFTLALVPVLYMVYRSYKLYIGRMEQEKKHAESTAALHLRTIEALAMAIEAKDECTHDHLCRVQVYSLQVAQRLGLSADETQALHAASILHDIGKLAVPDYIISKPGKLTAEEFEKMKVHTTVGAAILEQVGFPIPVAPIVRSHHEKWDGTGYPDGLKGEDIPIGARILAAVDCLDALASERQYRRALPLDEAMEYVAGLAGRSFDPKVIEVLKNHYREFETLAKNSPVQKPHLEHEAVIRGEAPEAGLEADGTSGTESKDQAQAFISSIAAARHEMQTILEITQDLSGSLRLDEILLLVSERLRELVPFDCIAVYAREGEVLKPRYVKGEANRVIRRVDVPLGHGVSGWVAENQKPLLNGNPAVEPGYNEQGGEDGCLRSALSVPLVAGAEISGALTLYRREANAFSKDHLRVLLAVSDKISRALETSTRFQQAREEANTDELTGLPNARSLFMHLQDELSRCELEDKRVAVLVCDLDGFKQVNDNHGHLAGNELLKRVGGILKENCRDSDYVARMGGDEFVLVLTGIRPQELERKIETLEDLIRRASWEVCGHDLVGMSAGIAYFPEHGHDVEKLLSHADQKMYAAKRGRKAGTGKVVALRRVNGKRAIG